MARFSPSHRYVLADVFTSQRFGGNQLAVFPWAAAIPLQIMPHIARELNLSETVFVLPPESPAHTAKLRILTPGLELSFAGHPTVGTACILTAIGEVTPENGAANVIFEEGVGPVPVQIRMIDGQLSSQFSVPKLPEFGPEPPDVPTLAKLLSIPTDAIGDGDLRPMSVSCGVPFVIIPVRDRHVLRQVRLNLAVWEAALSRFWAPHVYIFTRDVEMAGSAIRARMFAPAMGIVEDPATGGAAPALAGYLWRQSASPIGKRWRIEQGFEMGRPSLIDVETDITAGVITAIRVGGACVMVGRGEIEL
jgi:trans-2,3-dihydro-3-hydroxyanthranilate isomerase